LSGAKVAVFKTRNFLFIIFFIAVGVSSIYLFLDNKIKSVERANLENNLSRMIEMQKHGEIKFIDFSNIATFSWDKLYILGPYVILEKVPLKNHWPNSFPTSIEYSDGFVLLVFSDKKNVVQYLEYKRGTCDFSNASNIQGYDRYNTLFIVDNKNRCVPVN
jgi:hypothetical protein